VGPADGAKKKIARPADKFVQQRGLSRFRWERRPFTTPKTRTVSETEKLKLEKIGIRFSSEAVPDHLSKVSYQLIIDTENIEITWLYGNVVGCGLF
jgi:hypothetical protein